MTENGALLTPFEKELNGGDLPLRDNVRSSESSISKTPAAFLWGKSLSLAVLGSSLC